MDNLPISAFDIVVVLILLSSAILAFARGFVHETLSILGWIGAVAATIYGYPYALPHVENLVGAGIIGSLSTGAVIFVVTLVVLSLLIKAISDRVQDSALNAVDRSLGFLFGLARGALILIVCYMAADWFFPRFPELNPEQQNEAAQLAKEAKREGRNYDDPRYGWPTWIEASKSIRYVAAGSRKLWTLVPNETLGRAKSEAEKARDRADQLIEAEEAFRGLISPTPEVKEDLQKDGYGVKERQELERLLNQSTGSAPQSGRNGEPTKSDSPLDWEP